MSTTLEQVRVYLYNEKGCFPQAIDWILGRIWPRQMSEILELSTKQAATKIIDLGLEMEKRSDNPFLLIASRWFLTEGNEHVYVHCVVRYPYPEDFHLFLVLAERQRGFVVWTFNEEDASLIDGRYFDLSQDDTVEKCRIAAYKVLAGRLNHLLSR